MWEQVEKVKQMIDAGECRTNVAGFIANYAAQKDVQVTTVQLMIQTAIFHFSNPNPNGWSG